MPKFLSAVSRVLIGKLKNPPPFLELKAHYSFQSPLLDTLLSRMIYLTLISLVASHLRKGYATAFSFKVFQPKFCMHIISYSIVYKSYVAHRHRTENLNNV
jgi:hypothetical protein